MTLNRQPPSVFAFRQYYSKILFMYGIWLSFSCLVSNVTLDHKILEK